MPYRLPRFDTATLLVIDIQERLMPAMWADDQPTVLKNVTNLALACSELGGQTVYSEQYPKGLGPTVAALTEALSGATRLEKTEFSVMKNSGAEGLTLSGNVILTGMETHVCVLLTGLDLIAAGHRVWVPFDAVASRRREYRDNGLSMLEKAGASVINTESLIFAALGEAGGERFKRFSALMR